MRILFCIALLFTDSSLAQTWNLNDVSYLFPLPQNSVQLGQLLNPAQNHLIPKKIYLSVPLLDATGLGDFLYTESRVVAIRIDPCGIREGSRACDPQIRLIWQVIKEKSLDHSYTTLDAGMHSFYRLTPAQMKDFLAEVWKLKIENLATSIRIDTHFKPLGVHPTFLLPTLGPAFQSKLLNLVLKFCSERNLVQVTVEQIQPSYVPGSTEPDSPSTWFEFSGIVKTANRWQSIAIPNLGSPTSSAPVTLQKLFNESDAKEPGGLFINGAKFSILPIQDSRNRLDEVLSGRSWIPKDRPLLEGSFQVLRRFQNPHLTTTRNLDCVSCHLASPAEAFLNSFAPGLETEGLTLSARYKNPRPAQYNLRNPTVVTRSTQVFRAFGYFRTYPAINQRVINESAESAEYLNTRGLGL